MAESKATNIGTYHLSSNPKLYEVSRSNNFEFIIFFDNPETDALLLMDGVDADGDYTADEWVEDAKAQEVIRLSVVQAPVPHFTQDEIVIQRGNTKMYAAGVPTFSEGSLIVNDFIGANGKSVLMAWQRLSYDVTTEKVGRMADYKRNCKLVEYTPDYQQVRYWDLQGCWVKGISESDYNMESSDKRTITATIRFDRAIPHHTYEN